MTKAVKVTNTDPVNNATVHWNDSWSGPYHSVVLAPGDTKTVSPIATGTGIRVDGPVPASVLIEDIGTTPLAVVENKNSTLAAGGSASFAVAPGDYVVVS